MKKPLFIIFNDVHIKVDNTEDIIKATKFMAKYAVDNGIETIVFAGDLFHDRKVQRIKTLNTFNEMLHILEGIDIIAIPGNHDKTSYDSTESFLDFFDGHSNLTLFKDIITIDYKDTVVTFLPFFTDDQIVEKVNKATPSDILISHFSMNGSKNLGYTAENEKLTRKLFSKFKKVYLGHFHNTHNVTKDIVHLPSFIQDNFGEDNTKGFTVIYDDLSYEVIKGDMKEYIKVSVDIDEVNTEEINDLIREHEGSEDVIRFEFSGSETKLKSIDKSLFLDTGIDVKIKFEGIFDIDDLVIPEVVSIHDKKSVLKNFEEFCDKKGYDVIRGKELLLEYFKNKEDE